MKAYLQYAQILLSGHRMQGRITVSARADSRSGGDRGVAPGIQRRATEEIDGRADAPSVRKATGREAHGREAHYNAGKL